jgi:hypothetical protein
MTVRSHATATPVDPDRYDYTAAARDALHFAALFDRFIQNLRRYCLVTGSNGPLMAR